MRNPVRTPGLERAIVPALFAIAISSAPLVGCHCQSENLPLEVWYDGCSSVWQGPVCLLGSERQMFLWIKTAPSAQIEIDFGKNERVVELAPLDGGKRYKVAVPRGEKLGRVSASTDEARGSWQLALQEEPVEPSWLGEARTLRKEPNTKEAIRLVEPHLNDPEPMWKARALGLRGRLAMDLGQTEQACAFLAQAGELNEEIGHDSEAVADRTALAFQHIEFTRRFDEARRVLERTKLRQTGAIAEVVYLAESKAKLATITGDIRGALSHLRPASRLAARSGRIDLSACVDLELSLAEGLLGFHDKAAQRLASLRQLASGELPPCLRFSILTNEAWALILSAEATGQPSRDPIALFEEAAKLLDGPCSMPLERTNAQVNLALAYLQAGELDKSKAALVWFANHPSEHTTLEEAWKLEVMGRTDLAEGEISKALALFVEQERVAELAVLPFELWRAIVGQARALLAQEKLPAALERYEEAATLSEQALFSVPVGAGRAAFVAQQRSAIRERLSLLLRLGRPEVALKLARKERTRVWESVRLGTVPSTAPPQQRAQVDRALGDYWTLRSRLDESAAADWQLPADQAEQVRQERQAQLATLNDLLDAALGTKNHPTAEPSPEVAMGTLRLVFFPMASSSWLAFAQDEVGVEIAVLDAVDSRSASIELSQKLLAPFEERLQRCQKVEVLTTGQLEQVDFHALPWHGQPLDYQKLVVYGMDLPAVSAPTSDQRPVVVAVVDPGYDLPQARGEAQLLAQTVGQGNAQLRLFDRANVSAAQLGKELNQASLFHFSGHGSFDDSAGWDSALVLSEGARLSVSDVLALRNAPGQVVLLGCETARSERNGPGGMGIAHAFLLAGSQLVVAMSRPVRDDLAAQLSSELYRYYQGEVLGPQDVRSALLRLHSSSPEDDWNSVRILVR
ncbi:MAG: CHAT domain-containing protein [Myxococcota bacterium]|jgi:tetratricopeptide (TPR) repeat protein|nr:CHAT domain-containing protein [Myxococcota bacterium]